MPFLALCLDRLDGAELRRRIRAEHLAYMIRHRGRVVFGGPLQEDDGSRAVGSVMVLDFPDRSQVRQFLDEEPYGRAGLFETVLVHRLRQMVPETEPDLLEKEMARELEGHGPKA